MTPLAADTLRSLRVFGSGQRAAIDEVVLRELGPLVVVGSTRVWLTPAAKAAA